MANDEEELKKVDRTKFPHDRGKGLFYSDLKVLRSAAGYFLGRTCWVVENGQEGYEDMGSRETDYYKTEELADAALKSGEFTTRDAPENEMMYEENVPRPLTAEDARNKEIRSQAKTTNFRTH